MSANLEQEFDYRWEGVSIPDSQWHFHRRLHERYEVVLLPGEFSQILQDLKNGRALLVKRRTQKQAIYTVRLASQYERIYFLSDGIQLFTEWPPSKSLNRARRALTSK